MRARAFSVAAFMAAFAVVTSSASSTAREPAFTGASPIPPGIAARRFIKHVVVIVQENRTFDNLFGGVVGPVLQKPIPYAGADATVPAAVAPLLRTTSLDVPGAYGSHDAWACVNQGTPYPRFSTRQWIAVARHQIGPAVCTQHDYWFFHAVPQSQRQIYWEIARAYGLGDKFFAATASASYPPHQFLVTGGAAFGLNGSTFSIADQPEPEGGCFDDYPTSSVPVVGATDFFSLTLTNLPDSRGHCYDRPTYGDRLDEAGKSWIHYTTALPRDSGVFDGFINNRKWYRQTQNLMTPGSQVATHFAKAMQVLDDAGSLPQFAWVKPPCIKQSDHPGAGGHNGPNWVGSVINAIGRSPDWSSTVIFVIWDDWGGFYDHVVPPVNAAGRLGPGVRIPFLVVSPYLAHPGRVTHVTGHPGSIMRFVDELFGLKPLTGFDGTAQELDGWFDFTSANAKRPFVPIAAAAGAGRWNDNMCAGSMLRIAD
ncbi:MAG TPA: alkaline phosphatase family protein [Candidatus Elarobacter sp.]|jgi:phospholipase C